MRVLHLEDNALDADLVRRALLRHEPTARVENAPTLAQARARLERAEDFDLVLADLQLPDGSGLELLAEIRERGRPLAVVILTRGGDEVSAVNALKAGADDYLVKIADFSTRLARTLVAALARFRADAARRAQTLRVLYAEHNAADVDLTRRHFLRSAPHFRLEVVATAKQVLERLPANAGEPAGCDVLLLDYRLPEENALDVLKEVRTGRGLDLPIVLVTGQGDDAVAAAALRLGASDYLVKHSGYLHALPAVLENAHHRACLARDQATLRAIIDTEPECVKLLGRDGRLLQMNPAGLKMLEVESLAEAQERPLIDCVRPEYRAAFHRMHERVMAGEGEGLEFEIEGRKGGRRWLETRAVPMCDAGGNVQSLLGITRDITERKRAEAALRVSETRYRRILETANEGVWIVDAEARTSFVNSSMARMLGYATEEMQGRPLLDFMDEEGRQASERNFARRRQGISEQHDFKFLRKDGSPLFAVLNTNPIYDELGQFAGALAMVTDVSEQKQAEAALRGSEKRFRQIAENIHEVFWMRAAGSQKVEYVSPAYEAIWGRTCASLYADSSSWQEAIHPEDRERVVRSAAERQVRGDYDETYRIVRPDGGVRWIRARAFPVSDSDGRVAQIVGTATDITESRELEQRLRQSQKLEAVGTLAGGIAHDFNNILSGITGYSTLARKLADGRPELLDYLDEINRAGRRAGELVQQILAFSRPGDQSLAPLQLRHVVAEAVKLLRAAVPASVEFEVNLAAALPAVQGNASQLHQVVMNLGTNAWYAMRDRPGRLTVQLDPIVVEAAQARVLGGLAAGPYVRLTVADNGCGMDALTQERLFEPFFTTKAPGQGTGLGLAVVHGIVRGHGGVIRVSSEVDRGTTFEIYFPSVAAAPVRAEETRDDAAQAGRGERILFVDDEEPLARLGERTLRMLGYAADGERDVQRALNRIKEDPQRYSLVVTDQTMPGMSGLEFVAEIRRIRPGLPVVLASGYSTELTPERIRAVDVGEVLAKPYTVATLAAAVRRYLARPSTS